VTQFTQCQVSRVSTRLRCVNAKIWIWTRQNSHTAVITRNKHTRSHKTADCAVSGLQNLAGIAHREEAKPESLEGFLRRVVSYWLLCSPKLNLFLFLLFGDHGAIQQSPEESLARDLDRSPTPLAVLAVLLSHPRRLLR
jgi:hypothetical protein